jgi:hypothetical protein
MGGRNRGPGPGPPGFLEAERLADRRSEPYPACIWRRPFRSEGPLWAPTVAESTNRADLLLNLLPSSADLIAPSRPEAELKPLFRSQSALRQQTFKTGAAWQPHARSFRLRRCSARAPPGAITQKLADDFLARYYGATQGTRSYGRRARGEEHVAATASPSGGGTAPRRRP